MPDPCRDELLSPWPPLTWAGGAWRGSARLSPWRGFRVRTGAEPLGWGPPALGHVAVAVEAPSSDVPPTRAQERAWRRLLLEARTVRNEVLVMAAAVDGVLADGVLARLPGRATLVDALRTRVELRGVRVLTEEARGLAWLGLDLRVVTAGGIGTCAVLVHGTTAVDAGPSDAAWLTSQARALPGPEAGTAWEITRASGIPPLWQDLLCHAPAAVHAAGIAVADGPGLLLEPLRVLADTHRVHAGAPHVPRDGVVVGWDRRRSPWLVRGSIAGLPVERLEGDGTRARIAPDLPELVHLLARPDAEALLDLAGLVDRPLPEPCLDLWGTPQTDPALDLCTDAASTLDANRTARRSDPAWPADLLVVGRLAGDPLVMSCGLPGHPVGPWTAGRRWVPTAPDLPTLVERTGLRVGTGAGIGGAREVPDEVAGPAGAGAAHVGAARVRRG